MLSVKKSFAVAALTALFTLSSSVQADRLRLGHVTPPTHIWHQVSERFNENLQRESEGQHSINIFPLSQLGGDDQMIAMLQSGGIQLAVLTAGSLANRSEAMNAWFLPGMFADVEAAAAATELPIAQKLLDDLQEQRLVGLGYTLAGMRHVLSTRPMNSVEDFRNKKIRSFPNKLYNDWWSALGAAPTALAIGDVSSALTTNLLDAVDVDLDIVVGLRMYQQAPHLTLTNHMAFPGVVVASKRWWDSLDDDYRAMVMRSFKEAEAWGFKKQAEAELSNLAFLQEQGVNISEFDVAELEPVIKQITGTYTAGNPDIQMFYDQQAR
jgi:tripartite ATP-independent transporter DctP family solute receptor